MHKFQNLVANTTLCPLVFTGAAAVVTRTTPGVSSGGRVGFMVLFWALVYSNNNI